MINAIFVRYHSTTKLFHCYSFLKIHRTANPAEIKSKFLRLSKIYHPDNVESGNQARFIRLKEAYEIIKDAPLLNISQKSIIETEFDRDLSHLRHIQLREIEKERVYMDGMDEGVPPLYYETHVKRNPLRKYWDSLLSKYIKEEKYKVDV